MNEPKTNYELFADVTDEVIDRINELRKEKKVTFKQIADHLEVSVSTVNRYIGESHSDNITVLFLVGLADILGVEVADFFHDRKNAITLQAAVKPFKKRIFSNPERELSYFFRFLADCLK